MYVKKKRLTPRERALVRQIIKNPHRSQARISRSAGYSCQTSDNNFKKILARPRVKNYLDHLMEQSKILNRVDLLKDLEAGVKATETKFWAHEGKVSDQRVVRDYKTRLEYIRMAFQLRGDLKLNEADTGQVNNIMMLVSDANLALVLQGKMRLEDAIREVKDNGNNTSPNPLTQ